MTNTVATITVPPTDLAFALKAVAKVASTDKTLPGLNAVQVRITAAGQVNLAATDRYQGLVASVNNGSPTAYSGGGGGVLVRLATVPMILAALRACLGLETAVSVEGDTLTVGSNTFKCEDLSGAPDLSGVVPETLTWSGTVDMAGVGFNGAYLGATLALVAGVKVAAQPWQFASNGATKPLYAVTASHGGRIDWLALVMPAKMRPEIGQTAAEVILNRTRGGLVAR
jgi:hypothetical protein